MKDVSSPKNIFTHYYSFKKFNKTYKNLPIIDNKYPIYNPYLILILVSFLYSLMSTLLILWAMYSTKLGMGAFAVGIAGMELSVPAFLLSLFTFNKISKKLNLDPISIVQKIIIIGLISTSGILYAFIF
jgi:hypothetical protein